MKITEEQENILNTFKCERLSSDIQNAENIKNFSSDKGHSLVNYLQNFAWNDDITGALAFYIVKSSENEIILFFSLQCGALFSPIDEIAIYDNVMRKREIFLESSNINENTTKITMDNKSKYLEYSYFKNNVKTLIRLNKDKEKEKNKNCMLLNLYKKKDILNRCKKIQKEKVNVIEELNKKEITKEEFKTLEKILNYTYPNKLATTIPTKTSVTKLKQVEQEKLDIGIEELIGKQRNLEDKIEDVIEFPKPQFLKLEEKNKLTGAQKGTLIHLCMQNLDEKVDYNLIKVKELINSLVEKQIITKIEADNINPFKILEFTKSEIWRELKTAKLIEREKPFYLNIPANTIYNEEIEETILVQGVIDLYYVNKNNELILVDYKTDYIEKNKKYELVNKYKKQLELYQEALEQSFNKKVSKKYIYSTCLGQAIEI